MTHNGSDDFNLGSYIPPFGTAVALAPACSTTCVTSVTCFMSTQRKSETARLSISGCASSFSRSPVSGSAISRSPIPGSASSWSTWQCPKNPVTSGHAQRHHDALRRTILHGLSVRLGGTPSRPSAVEIFKSIAFTISVFLCV